MIACETVAATLFCERRLLQLSCDYGTSNATRLQEQIFIVVSKLGWLLLKTASFPGAVGANWAARAVARERGESRKGSVGR